MKRKLIYMMSVFLVVFMLTPLVFADGWGDGWPDGRTVFSNRTDTESGASNVGILYMRDGNLKFIDSNGNEHGVAGISGVTIVDPGRLYLPQQNDATTPTIAFGDRDTGVYEESDDVMVFAVGGSARWKITANGAFQHATNGNAAGLNYATSTATVPSLWPNRNNTDTGIGHAAADQLSLIAGGLEMARLDGTATSGASAWPAGGVIIGDISGATVDVGEATTGITSFLAIASGVTPSAPTDASTLFTWSGNLFTINDEGTITQLGSFDPISGQATTYKHNLYTGKTVRKNIETGNVTITYGSKANWLNDQKAKQKKRFTRTEIEITPSEAFDIVDKYIEEGYDLATKYKTEDGKVVSYQEKQPKMVLIGYDEVLKPNVRLDMDTGKLYRKRTGVEFIVDLKPIRDKWDTLPQFLKDAIERP